MCVRVTNCNLQNVEHKAGSQQPATDLKFRNIV